MNWSPDSSFTARDTLRIPYRLERAMADLIAGQQVNEADRQALEERSLLVDGVPNPLLVNPFDAIANPLARVRIDVSGVDFIHYCSAHMGRSATTISQPVGSPLDGIDNPGRETEIFPTFFDHLPAFILRYAQLGPRPTLGGDPIAVPFDRGAWPSSPKPNVRSAGAQATADVVAEQLPEMTEDLRAGRWRCTHLTFITEVGEFERAWLDTPTGILRYADTRTSGTMFKKTTITLLQPCSPADVLLDLVDLLQAMPPAGITPDDLKPHDA